MHSIKIATLAILSVWITACGKNSTKSDGNPLENPAQPAATTPSSNSPTDRPWPGEPHSRPGSLPSWQTSIVAKCPDLPPENCLGSYGFEISSNGVYRIGPGPQGQILTGDLSTGELESISEVFSTLNEPGPQTLECQSKQGNHKNLLEVSLTGGVVGKIRETGNEFYCSSIPRRKAEELQDLIHGIMKKYYPPHFPGSCVNAIVSLEHLYETMKKCESDSDCTYLDDHFRPIPPHSNPYEDPYEESCGWIRPLRVANSFDAATHQLKLVQERQITREICNKEGGSHLDCLKDHLRKSKHPRAAPVCHKGVCHINPHTLSS